MSQQITIQNAGRFALAGDAIITMVRPQRILINGDTETVDPEVRFTYRIQRAKAEDADNPDPKRPWFAKVLSGPQNTRDYQFLGTIFPERNGDGIIYRHGRKSRVDEGAPSARGIGWFITHLSRLIGLRAEQTPEDMFPDPRIEANIAKVEATLNQLRFYHEGRCGKCARVLTVPESIILGIGPVCAKGEKLGILELLAMI